MASWPITFPKPNRSGFKIVPSNPTIQTDMDGGNTKARRRTLVRNDRLECSVTFTDTQMAMFRAWFESTAEANGGANWFEFPIPLGNGGYSDVDARFTQMWEATLYGLDMWSVSLPLEIRYA